MAEKLLKFNLKELSDAKTLCDNMITWLITEKEQLVADIESLEQDWNTPAGKEFLSALDTTWITKVEEYANITRMISELLGTAITQYGYVEYEAGLLSSVIPEKNDI